jgi:hypothetical protein
MVDIPRLLDAVKTLAWRHGCVKGDHVSYRAEPDGSHVITIVVPPLLVDKASLPKEPVHGPPSWGAWRTPENPYGNEKK